MDDHLRACDFLITRAPGKNITIPTIPGTDVQVFRLDGRHTSAIFIPPTRVFFRMEDDDKAHMLNIEAIPENEYFDELGDVEQLQLTFEDDEYPAV